jgi:hypothetical protein
MRIADLELADQDWFLDELYIAWRAAATEADIACVAWRRVPDRDSYALYVAMTDQADAAALALAAEHSRLPARRPPRAS